jgi:hypothetical protein
MHLYTFVSHTPKLPRPGTIQTFFPSGISPANKGKLDTNFTFYNSVGPLANQEIGHAVLCASIE